MKPNTIRYSVSIPDIENLISLDSKDQVIERLDKLRKQSVRFQDPIAELGGKTIFDLFLSQNRPLADIKMFYEAGLSYEKGRDTAQELMFKAAFKKRPEVFSWLLDDVFKRQGIRIDPNVLDYSDRVTPFFIAATSNLNESMSTLFDMGVDMTIKNRFEQTALHNYLKFTKQLRKQTINDLLDYAKKSGVDPQWLMNEQDQEGHTPLMTLIFRSNRRSKVDKERCLRSLRYFLSAGADPSHQDKRGYTPMMWVAIEGDLDQMKLLREYGARTDAFNHAGDSALTLAVVGEKAEIVEYLLESGVDPNTTCEDKPFKNPLLIACQNDSHEIALELLNYGANTEVSNSHHDNHTPLIYAIKNGNRTLVQKLLERGADPDRENDHGMTPLMYAIYNFRDDQSAQSGIIEDLINSGASLSKKNNKGITATQLVSELNLEIKIGRLMYDRNLDYISRNYFAGDKEMARKHLVTEHSDVFELLHNERIENSDHMMTFMKEKSEQVISSQQETQKQSVTEGYRLMTRAVFLVTPSVTAVSTTVDNLMKDNGNSVPLAATAGVATMAAYFLSHNTDERMKIKMAIKDIQTSIGSRILDPIRDTMIRGYIDSSLYINEKLETLVNHWERVCDQFSKLTRFIDRTQQKKSSASHEDLVKQLGELLTDDQLVEIIDAIQSADSANLDKEAGKIRDIVKSMSSTAPSREKSSSPRPSTAKIVGVQVEGHDPSEKIKKMASGSDLSNDF